MNWISFADFCRGVAAPSADAQRRASARLASALDEAPVERRQLGGVTASSTACRIVRAPPRRRSCSSSDGDASGLFGTVRDLLSSGAPVKSKIAFQSFRDGRFDAYVMNVDGSGQRRLTAKPEVVFPVWSPDGRKVAFASADRHGGAATSTSTS